jgi:hypothetical protein
MTSQEEAQLLLTEYQQHRQVVARSLRKRIAFMEAIEQRLSRDDYEGRAKLRKRIGEMKGKLRRCS